MNKHYVLENSHEAQRLEEQSTFKNYDLTQELSGLIIPPNSRVLDAGCGTGVLCRYLAKHHSSIRHIDGIDASPDRLKMAYNESKSSSIPIEFLQANLESIPFPDNTFDYVFSRYVFEHLQNPEKVTGEIYRVLKPGGIAIIIDIDSAIFNIYTQDSELQKMIEIVLQNISCDLFIGRKLGHYFTQKNFKIINWNISPMIFKGNDLQEEINLNKQRFAQAKDEIRKILSPDYTYELFYEKFFNELKNQATTLFYNKMIIECQRPY